MERCPGAGMKPIVRRCPQCGEEVEFLDLDFERACKCGKRLYREADQSCVVWCEYAEACIEDMLGRKMISPETAGKLRDVARKREGKKGEASWERFF